MRTRAAMCLSGRAEATNKIFVNATYTTHPSTVRAPVFSGDGATHHGGPATSYLQQALDHCRAKSLARRLQQPATGGAGPTTDRGHGQQTGAEGSGELERVHRKN